MIPAANKNFKQTAERIKAEQKADAAASQAKMDKAIAEWNALTPEQRQAKTAEMRKQMVGFNTN